MLLEWFKRNARDLPWRRTQDPYAIWVSEIMLQQTQVKTVLPYWERWMRALPTIGALARARPETIHKLWEGLGYYTRVRNLQKAAQLVLRKHQGKFPSSFQDILELPGVGRYTAGAVCSIAFNQPCPILDGNVIRVLTRVFGVEGNPKEKHINAALWVLAERLVKQAQAISVRTKSRPLSAGASGEGCRKGGSPSAAEVQAPHLCSHLNQSLMELGALVCTPRQPSCGLCPLAVLCVARQQGRTQELPSLSPRLAVTKRRFVAFVVQRQGKFLVRQRPPGVVNAHLWEFPNIEVANNAGDHRLAGHKALGFTPSETKPLKSIHHSITRYRIRLDVFQAASRQAAQARGRNGRWLTKSHLHRLPFTSAHKKILAGL